MTEIETIRFARDERGIVTLTFDDPGRGANTMSVAYVASMDRALARLEAELDDIRGIILNSAKSTFFAGGDLRELIAVEPDEAGAFAAHMRKIKGQLRRLETLGRPVVAIIEGAALGGGLEIALAAHRRIILDVPRIKLGFPEVTLGLLPGAAGVVRSVRMLGITEALDRLLLDGRQLDPEAALELGIADELAPDGEAATAAAKDWIADNPDATQPWDCPGYRLPGGSPDDPAMIPTLQGLPPRLEKQLRGADYPAPRAILAVAVEGAQVTFEEASEIEGRYFISLVTGQVAKNMIKGLFFDMQTVRGRRGSGTLDLDKVAVLGAGMMGAGIAYSCASAGLEVVLSDVDRAAAERGRSYSERLVAKAIERGRLSPAAAEELLARIVATDDPTTAGGSHLAIEAVFEDPAVKASAYSAIEPHLAPGAILASNTSTLPITGLAETVADPQRFIGLHFFSPVDKMPLLEIIRGRETDDATLQSALAFAARIGKTAIVVNDSRGFFTSRVIARFLDESIAMIGEGIPAPSIEQASAQAGYPAPVLQLIDELNLSLIQKIRDETRAAREAEGKSWDPHPADAVVDRMLALGRAGRLAGAGFYNYEEGRRTRLWSGLAEIFDQETTGTWDLRELIDRMLVIEALEAVKCVEEGVIESVADANVGSVLGIGFPRWTGGVLQYVDGFDGGPTGFAARCQELAGHHGARFEPPAGLVATATDGGSYADHHPPTISGR
ncbi:MAG: enoyl-CoA hydratase/isomerase family protein [Actinobacteria bacterium]|nr:enoyl-CoA hydratase/isomerase family protein [Actinomycetota bacterium]